MNQPTEKGYYIAEDIVQILGVCESHAYKVIRDLNKQLKKQGFITVAGRVSKKYFHEHYYG